MWSAHDLADIYFASRDAVQLDDYSFLAAPMQRFSLQMALASKAQLYGATNYPESMIQYQRLSEWHRVLYYALYNVVEGQTKNMSLDLSVEKHNKVIAPFMQGYVRNLGERLQRITADFENLLRRRLGENSRRWVRIQDARKHVLREEIVLKTRLALQREGVTGTAFTQENGVLDRSDDVRTGRTGVTALLPELATLVEILRGERNGVVTRERVSRLSVHQLKSVLAKIGTTTNGNKSELVARIFEVTRARRRFAANVAMALPAQAGRELDRLSFPDHERDCAAHAKRWLDENVTGADAQQAKRHAVHQAPRLQSVADDEKARKANRRALKTANGIDDADISAPCISYFICPTRRKPRHFTPLLAAKFSLYLSLVFVTPRPSPGHCTHLSLSLSASISISI